MDELVIVVIIAIGYAIAHAVKGKMPSKGQKQSRPVQSRRQTVAARPAPVPPVAETAAPQAKTVPVQSQPVQQVFPGTVLSPGAMPVGMPGQIAMAQAALDKQKAVRKSETAPKKAAVQKAPLPHLESPPHTQGGEGSEGPGMHPCRSYENSARILRSNLQVSSQRMREAVVLSEILDKPVSMRRRWNQR